MKKILIATLFAVVVALPASAQKINLDFPGLAEKATETVDVTLDSSMLQFAAKFLDDDADREAREMVKKLEGIYVRSYGFEREGMYDTNVIQKVRAQLGPQWKKIVNVSKRGKQAENVEIYTDMRNGGVFGLVIISAEPKELTIVNLVGPIDIDKLSNLEGQFGIPKVSKESK